MLITLDSADGTVREREKIRGERMKGKKREFRIRVNLNGGELNGEDLEYPKEVSS